MKIFLDFDGTILDVKNKNYRAYINTLSHGGFSTVSETAYWSMKRHRVTEEEIALKTTTPIFAKYYADKRKSLLEKMEYLALDRVFDKISIVLSSLSTNHDLYLVTLRQNGMNLDYQLLFFDLRKYFKYVYSCSVSKVKKEHIIKHEICDCSTCVIIGDTGTDIEAGKVLGIKTVAVTSGVRGKHLLEKTCPDLIVESICDPKLLNWIGLNSGGIND